jgi:hypothetical protein
MHRHQSRPWTREVKRWRKEFRPKAARSHEPCGLCGMVVALDRSRPGGQTGSHRIFGFGTEDAFVSTYVKKSIRRCDRNNRSHRQKPRFANRHRSIPHLAERLFLKRPRPGFLDKEFRHVLHHSRKTPLDRDSPQPGIARRPRHAHFGCGGGSSGALRGGPHSRGGHSLGSRRSPSPSSQARTPCGGARRGRHPKRSFACRD